MIRKCKTLYPYKSVNQKFQPHSRDCTRVSKDRGSDSRACNTYISNAYVYNACTHRRKTEGRSNVSHTHQQQTSLDSNFACCSTRALRRSPFCGRAEGEREGEGRSLARGVARVSSGHLFNWEPTWPPELTPASDRPICTITSSWKCVPCHVHLGFSSCDLDSLAASVKGIDGDGSFLLFQSFERISFIWKRIG